jgi:CheY-like chemotaxis protein
MPPRRPLILIVDDVADHRELYREYLEAESYRTETADSGQSALDAAFARRPDLIVMDLGLPEMDGREATRRLKADERTAHIPVIALTGHSAEQSEGSWDAFISKPCFPEELVGYVKSMLYDRERGIG